MNPRRLLSEARGARASALAREIGWRMRRRLWLAARRAEPEACSYAPETPGELPRLLPVPAPALAPQDIACLGAWCARYMRHEFDLLGSGWTRVSAAQGADIVGRINPGNRARVEALRHQLDAHYVPIDWQVDFKSGYRWSESTWHRDIRAGAAGADIKVPWELARMQHLPQLALGAHAGIVAREGAAGEFRNQLLDFIAHNPPGWGVNWACAMDVAIRAANWLLAWDLLSAAGARFDGAFTQALRASIADHGRHIAATLEWHPRYRGNHYLANVAGFLFCGAYLDGDEADRWLAFGVRELGAETARQFNADGSSFEASTCYHRLSCETVTFATALWLALPRARRNRLGRLPGGPVSPMHGLSVQPLGIGASPFGQVHFARLRAMARFTRAVTKPNGRVVQIGDNDNGRFAKLSWSLNAGKDDPLDHRPLVAAVLALLGDESGWAGAGGFDAAIFRQVAGAADPAPRDASPEPRLESASWEAALAAARSAAGAASTCRVLARGPGLAKSRSILVFPDFGLYVLRTDRIWLSVRCGEAGIEPLGAHAHNDQLAIEFVLDGDELLRDPGTYAYTAAPALRNVYRSAAAHHVPRVAGREPARLDRGLFELRDRTGARCVHFSARGFVGLHFGYGAPVWRIVALTDDMLTVEDRSLAGPLDEASAPPPFSPGYGMREG